MVAETIIKEMAATSTPSFMFETSNEIKEAVMAKFSKSGAARDLWDDPPANSARAYIKKLHDCDLLLIDDLGKARMTPAVAEEMFGLINSRHDYNRPLIWSANSTPEQIAASLPEDMAGPFAGRLHECSTIYQLK